MHAGAQDVTEVEVSYNKFVRLPSLDSLTSLKTFRALGDAAAAWRMDEEEGATKFDRLTKVTDLILEGNMLTRVPGLTNMRSLRILWLGSNEITTIYPGDFQGATRLVALTISNNKIVSVATEAFAHLKGLAFTPQAWEPLCDAGMPFCVEGEPFRDKFGVGLWRKTGLETGLGYFGPSAEWVVSPISFSPNPVGCVWVGPLVSDLDCSTCVLGYELSTTVGSNSTPTCTKPEFRPYNGWEGSADKDSLRLRLDHTVRAIL